MRLLLVFLKEPLDGRVKKRLAADVGDREAARRYKALVEVLLRQLAGLENCRIRFCFSPDDAEESVRFWLLPEMDATTARQGELFHAASAWNNRPQEIDFRAQGGGHMGKRLERAFSAGFFEGFTEIAAIRSDCPACGARWINAAFSRLLADPTRDLVIGPATDGGYYLIAKKSPRPELFQGIPWSGDSVYAATLSLAHAIGLNVESLPQLSGVSTLRDWEDILKTPLAAAIKKAMGATIDEDLSELSLPVPPESE